MRFRQDNLALRAVFRRFCGVGLWLLLAACAATQPASPKPASPATPEAQITLFPTPTPSPTVSLPPPTPTPIPAHTTTTINVRAGPGVNYPSLGLLAANQTVQIIGQDEGGEWYLILYPTAEAGHGWVAAPYVQRQATVSPPVIAPSSPTASGPLGRTSQRLNVRSGPGLSFESLGVIEAETTVNLTGRNRNSTWLQIQYPPGPGGHGWISAAYVQVEDILSLPVLDEFGSPVPVLTAGPTSRPMTPTPTLGPARADGDSAQNPAVRVFFSPTGSRTFLYSSDVSLPEGDAADWVEFTPYAASGGITSVTLRLTCEGNGEIQVEVWQDGETPQAWEKPACNGEPVSVTLKAGVPYLVRLSPEPSASLTLIRYTLAVSNDS